MIMQLLHGDCLELMKDIPDGSIDAIICDPPYGITELEWDVIIPYDKLWEQYKRIIKENAPIILFSQMPFGAELIMSNRNMFRYEIIWHKTCPGGFANCNKMPMRSHENILVFYNKLPTYHPIKSKGTKYRRTGGQMGDRSMYKRITRGTKAYEGRFPTDVITYSNHNGALWGNTNKVVKHFTSKPVDLLKYLIKTYTNEGDLILDSCMGSGATGVAAVLTNRDFIGIEKNDEFFEMAQERIMKQYNHKVLERGDKNEPVERMD